ncbi:MAG: phospho-N-acetylmuramoyl-pentapeptide-transferase [Flavobacteriales bacterium]|uniref:phospho-N-acetylmuramoyl-pentapeptide- transferase n=1 Tax=Blattabacterium sp. (Mastotermes darwiniensis) TaxID=39768 RepID=UPI0011D1D050|nr:phospho-N-acetylmuramoyl-pentapeptide-transferase [Blattabacterium sp. (Mastotermes darwiniensis)]MDR1804840.1 phospho-N-acetylmuramoyl-pentapeptide-transferase [Flavobacteriales bacterium]
MIIFCHIFKHLIPGINSILLRSGISFFLSMIISLIVNKKMIAWNERKKSIGERVRDLGITGQKEKEGTTTMGGILIIISTLIPTIFFSKLNNLYVIILIITTLWIGSIGFIDDYIKIKYNKNGLSILGKILGQILLGLFIGSIMSFNNNNILTTEMNTEVEEHRFNTTLPLIVSNNEFDYAYILSWYNQKWKKYAWIIFIPIVIFMVTFLSNGANITDGIDGLTAGISSIILATLSLFSLVSSNKTYSSHFHFIYIPHIEEILIFSFSFLGSLIGFLWYNIYPAEIFMGDSGSLTIGSVIATISILTKKELILPILGGIFFVENISVIVQVLYFRFYKKKYGIGKRIFLMAPLHHHFQKLGYHESKIAYRFFIIQMILSMIVFILLTL